MQDAGITESSAAGRHLDSSAQNRTCVSLTAYAMFCFVSPAQAADGCSTRKPPTDSQPYIAGLAAFNAGRAEESYLQLKTAYLECSSNARYRNDYIVAAASAGHASEAIAIVARRLLVHHSAEGRILWAELASPVFHGGVGRHQTALHSASIPARHGVG